MSGSFPAVAGTGLKRRDALKWIGGGTLELSTLARIAAGAEADRLEGATVYAGSSDGTLYALDAATGEQAWVFAEPSDRIRSSPVVVDGVVYFGCHDGTLYAVEAGGSAERGHCRCQSAVTAARGSATDSSTNAPSAPYSPM